MPPGAHVTADYRHLKLSLKAHPVSFLRGDLDRRRVTPNARLASLATGTRLTIAGLVLVRQRPGKGNAIFLTLEDEKTVANVIFWKRTFNRYRPVVMGARFVRVTGRLQQESDVVHIVAERIEDLTPWLSVLSERAAGEARDRVQQVAAREPQAAIAGSGGTGVRDLASETVKVMPRGRNFR
jgi:error-prone DNA polymerase